MSINFSQSGQANQRPAEKLAKRATLEMGTGFYRKGLSLNIAGDESPQFENNVLTHDGPLDLAVHHHASSLDATVKERLG